MWNSRLTFGFGLLLALALLFYTPTQPVGFALLYALAGLFFLSLGSILLVPRVLSLEEETEKETLEKEESSFYYSTVHNRSWIPYYSISQTYRQHRNNQWQGVHYEKKRISAGEGLVERQDLCFPYRGNYEVGMESMVITDFLGLFHRVIRSKEPLQIMVLPRPDTRFLSEIVAHQEEGSARNLFTEDYTTIEDVRPYQEGDSLKKVHWKLSAKWNNLMIKNYEPISSSNVVLFLDTKSLDLPEQKRLPFEDHIISFVAAAMNFYALENTPAEFIYGVVPLERVEISSLAEQQVLYRVLAQVEFSHPETLVPHYYRTIAQDSRPLFIYFFLFDLTPEILSGLGRFLASGHSIFLYYFHSDDLPLSKEQRDLLAGLRGQGVAVYDVEVTDHA